MLINNTGVWGVDYTDLKTIVQGIATSFANSTISSVGEYGFAGWSNLQCLVLTPNYFSNYALNSCYRLTSLYLLCSSVPLGTASIFFLTPFSNYTSYTSGQIGSLYVPQSLVSAYQTDTIAGWSAYSSMVVGLSDNEILSLKTNIGWI